MKGLGLNNKYVHFKRISEGAGKELGGGGGGGLREDVVWCEDDNTIVVTCSHMPSQGVFSKQKFSTKTVHSNLIVIKLV